MIRCLLEDAEFNLDAAFVAENTRGKIMLPCNEAISFSIKILEACALTGKLKSEHYEELKKIFDIAHH